MKFLLAVDGSAHSRRATAALIKNLRLYKPTPQVILLNVYYPVPQVNFGPLVSRKMVVRYYKEQADRALVASRRLLDRAGIRYQAKVLAGPIAQTIVRQCRAMHCDLIFMGTRGMGGVGNMLLGSTATKVVHLSSVPVVLVK
ncbi:MAG TPA: universal stress protein [Burkholderiales bacterium]|nr:universal stress protein [Burkholderiales bacterium]